MHLLTVPAPYVHIAPTPDGPQPDATGASSGMSLLPHRGDGSGPHDYHATLLIRTHILLVGEQLHRWNHRWLSNNWI